MTEHEREKREFKRKEMEHELGHEDEERYKTMTRKEILEEIREQAEAEARRERDGW